MFLHWGEHSQSALVALVVVVVDVFGDHLNHCFTAIEFTFVVTFSFQDPPESFHWPVIDAFPNSGHALDHSVVQKFLMEHVVCILESPIAIIPNSG